MKQSKQSEKFYCESSSEKEKTTESDSHHKRKQKPGAFRTVQTESSGISEKIRTEQDCAREHMKKFSACKGTFRESSGKGSGKAKPLKRAVKSAVAFQADPGKEQEDTANPSRDVLHHGKVTASDTVHMAGSLSRKATSSFQNSKAFDTGNQFFHEAGKADRPDTIVQASYGSSHPYSRWVQKKQFRKRILFERGKGPMVSNGEPVLGTLTKNAKGFSHAVKQFVQRRVGGVPLLLICALSLLVVAGTVSSCTTFFQGGTQVLVGTSFTASDQDILGANEDYKAMEENLRKELDNYKTTHPGYDHYVFQLDEINHNPYELTAFLTVLFEDFKREEVQGMLKEIFQKQYILTTEETTETKTNTTQNEDGTTTEEEYEVTTLTITLKNNGLQSVVAQAGLTEDQLERYYLLLQTKGNRPYLFKDDIYANDTGPYLDYDIPGEALTDERFSNMIREAEKYLGYPYVWGGSSPASSFDCSGFVSWVLNHCGNGWNIGRQGVKGILSHCAVIPPSEAQPGDLIFFQKTYNIPGASHIGIYVGNGMMIHCGNPISYASIQNRYWQQHFYCFGRMKG